VHEGGHFLVGKLCGVRVDEFSVGFGPRIAAKRFGETTYSLRVIPAVMAGGAVTGALSELLHVGLHAPHGGIFVLFAVDNKLMFLIALAAGTAVAAFLVILLKGMRGEDPAAEAVDAALVSA
jgi:hypothetical protein